ncbi:hypothetical protein [Dorea formicigenerans]|uniref:hypothetical protein n=1 Tax=Dorea formicigenerans TaxID=39486 RepID=UPI001FBA7EB8|nr:hypothetical protein [Dorea formicigenerans]
MEIVSGLGEKPHVTSQQFRQILEGTIGQKSYIVTSGENLEPELAANNLLKIRSGMMSHHGNVSSVKIGTYDEVELTNGSQGMKRIDLVVNRYTRNAETNIEKNEWVVIMGTPVASNPVAPTYTVGNLQKGDLVDDCPVFELHYDGINVTEVKKMLSVLPNVAELNSKWTDELTGNNQYCKYRYVKFGKTAVIIGNLAANNNNNISIKFPFAFKFTPSASVTLESSASSNVNPLITEISTTSFKADSTPGSTSKTAARFIIIGEIE